MKYSIFLFNDSYFRKPNSFLSLSKRLDNLISFKTHNIICTAQLICATENSGVINYLLIERGSMNGRKVDFLSIKAIYKYSSFLTFTLIRKFTS